MAAPLSPAKQLANGKDAFWLVPTIATPSAPTATEINAAGALNVTGYILDDYEGITVSVDKVTLPGVMLETTTTEINGETKLSSPDITFTFDPQAASSADSRKPWKMLVEDSGGSWSGYLVQRMNVAAAADAAVTVGQKVDVFKVDIQSAIPKRSSAGADGIYTFTAAVNVTQALFNKAVA
jgi:hypothetical protein